MNANLADSIGIGISFFSSARDDSPEFAEQTWEAFCDGVRRIAAETPRPLDKTTLAAFSPARFDGRGRRKKNVCDVSMLVVDLDDVPSEVGLRVVELPWRKLVYETPTPPKEGCVRWRVAFPLARSVSAEDWTYWWRSALRDLGLDVPADPKCSDASRIYFLPCGGAGVWDCEGPVLDPDAIGAKRVIREGERNDRLFRAACSARARGLDVRAMLAAENARCAEPLDDEELERIALSAERYEEGVQLDDIGNAQRFAQRHGEGVRHVAGLGWLAWDGARWERDESGSVMECAKETARSFFIDAAAAESDGMTKALAKHAKDSASKGRLEAMVALARSIPEIATPIARLDADPWLLNVRNGAIDLRTGMLREHRRDDACSKVAGCELGSFAPQKWIAFLNRVVPDVDEREFLRRWVGYSLTGVATEHALAFLHGPGRNGKSVFLETIATMLGDYATKAPEGLLHLTTVDKHPAEIMALRGARLAWCPEVDQGIAWNEARVKNLASSDPLTARYMRQDFVTFNPSHKLWIAGNHRPRIAGTDEAIWARLRLIPFDVTIPESERDPKLTEKLRSELPQILLWAVEGCLAWQRDGLGAPRVVADATNAYRREEDVVGRFLAEVCEVRASGFAESGRIYARFTSWASKEGERPHSHKAFAQEVVKRGFKKGKLAQERGFFGLNISDQKIENQNSAKN